MGDRTILNVHLRGAHSDDAVVAALSRGLAVDRERIRDIAAEDARTAPVLLDRAVAEAKRARAFRTTVSTYVDPAQGVTTLGDDLALARLLARELLVDALAPLPESEDPYQWLLVKPDGRAFVVSQTVDDDELDDVVVDDAPAALVPWAAS